MALKSITKNKRVVNQLKADLILTFHVRNTAITVLILFISSLSQRLGMKCVLKHQLPPPPPRVKVQSRKTINKLFCIELNRYVYLN